MYGEGDQTRSFQYVSDLVDGLVALMNSNYSLPVNLGNPDEYTIKQFADIIKSYVGKFGFILIAAFTLYIQIPKALSKFH